jgi:hypothetical protein
MGTLDAQLSAATAKAVEELSVKSIYVVQCETAVTWAGRALAAYSMYGHTGKLQWLLDAGEYAHEALEHAALAEPHLYEGVFARLHDAKLAVAAIPPVEV